MKRLTTILAALVLSLWSFGDVMAQCAMCRAVVESNLESGETTGAGINSGILYLMPIPYILLATVGFLIYRHHRQKDAAA